MLDKILEYLKSQKDSYDKPGSYQEEDWYIKCAAKSDAYEDIINYIKYLDSSK